MKKLPLIDDYLVDWFCDFDWISIGIERVNSIWKRQFQQRRGWFRPTSSAILPPKFRAKKIEKNVKKWFMSCSTPSENPRASRSKSNEQFAFQTAENFANAAGRSERPVRLVFQWAIQSGRVKRQGGGRRQRGWGWEGDSKGEIETRRTERSDLTPVWSSGWRRGVTSHSEAPSQSSDSPPSVDIIIYLIY